MLKRPSSRRHSAPQEIQINLVPMLDALVTMIAFLMYTMAFMSLAMLESPLPVVSTEENATQIEEKPLQLTLSIGDQDVMLWSPFDLIPQITIPHQSDGRIDTLKIHEKVLELKQKFPTEKKIVLVPQANTSYESIISIIDSVKYLEKTDPLISALNPKTGVQEQVKELFSETVFGNLLGGE